MNKESIAKAVPFVERKLANKRDENKTALVKSILSSSETPSSITSAWVSETVNEEFNVDLDEGPTEVNANSILESLQSQDILEQKEDGSYKIISEPDVGSLSGLIDPLWNEFEHQIKNNNPDVDLHFVNSSIEDAFYGFFEDYLGFLCSTSVELSEYEVDQLYMNDLESLLDDTIEKYPLHDPDLFRNELLEYLEEPSESLLEVVNDFYMVGVNVDLLSREKELNFDEIPGSGKKLLLDTNVLVALLCETDNSHPLASSVTKRSKEIGFDLVYTKDTRNELNRLIHGSKREMDGFHDGDKKFDAIRSQFVHDYFQRDNIGWGEYVSEISDWERLINLNWGISKFDERVDTKSDVYEFSYDTIKQLEKTQDDKPRESKENKINHDANVLSITAGLREKRDESVELGPYLLTLHNKLTTVSEIGKENYWDERIALQLRTWLNYLATFTPSDLSDANSKGVAIAIIESSRSSEPEINSIQQYSRLIAPKVGLDSREEDVLADYFVNHPLSREMEKALENERGDQAEQLAKQMLEDEDRLERFAELESQSERLDELRKNLSDLRKQWEKEKEKREQLEDILENQNKVEINVSATANASVQNDIQALNEEINEFIDLLDTRLSEGYADSDLPEPPGPDASVEETEDWLRELKLSVASTGAVSALEPYAAELLETASSII